MMKLSHLPDIKICFLALCISSHFIFPPFIFNGQAQNDSLNTKKLKNLAIGTAIGNAVAMTALGTIWYADQPSQSFQFFDDSREWKQLDKMGHFQSTYHISNFYYKALRNTGLSSYKSNLWASLTGFLLISQIEIFDGFSSGYGASWSDLGFNAAGALLAFGQNHLLDKPFINPKYSFQPTPLANIRPELLGDGLLEEWLKDYNGQTFWFSFDMHQVINKWPKWLNLALGYGGYNLISADDQTNIALGYDAYRQYYFSLDFDFSYIKSKSGLLNAFIYFINMIHLPAPSLEYNRTNGLTFHWLYF